MNEKFENYIKDLSPELQKKARACKSLEELTHLAAENDLELPEEALEHVSGGCTQQMKCPKCGSYRIEVEEYEGGGLKEYCKNCGQILLERH